MNRTYEYRYVRVDTLLGQEEVTRLLKDGWYIIASVPTGIQLERKMPVANAA